MNHQFFRMHHEVYDESKYEEKSDLVALCLVFVFLLICAV